MRPVGRISALLLLTLFPSRLLAQRTIVSGTVTDAGAVPYSGGSLTITLVTPVGTAGAYLNGAQIAGNVGPLTLDSTGSFLVQLADNTQIKCANAQGQIVACVPQTQWGFAITESPGVAPPLGTGPQLCNVTLTITGTAQSISPSLSTCPALTHVGASPNAALKPSAASGIQYVATTGNDSNDGLSWGSAKLTIYAAMLALPGAVQSPPRAGTGTIFINDNVTANPTANAGIWIMGSTDPNFANPPAGWLQAPTANNPLAFFGEGCKTENANSAFGQCQIQAGQVGGTDPTKPAVWLSGNVNPMLFQNLSPVAPPKSWVLAICSNGDRTGTCGIANKQFVNVASNVSGNPGSGPGLDIGGSSFNLRWDKFWASSSAVGGFITQTGLSRGSNVVTVTLTGSTTNPAVTGDNCGITGAIDPSFNFSARNVTVSGGGLTVTMTENGSNPDATSGGGTLVCDRGLPVVSDPGAGGASGLMFVNGFQFNGGGVRMWGGTLYIADGYSENGDSPIVWFNGGTFNSQVVAKNVQQADIFTPTFGFGPPLMRVESGNNPRIATNSGADNFVLEEPAGQAVYTEGPITLIGASNQNGSALPIQFGQQGIVQGHLYAQTDAGRNSPQTVRFANLAPTNPGTWTVSTGTLTTGIADRDGGTNAAQATTAAGGLQSLTILSLSQTVAVGDWIICGVWVRALATFTPYGGAGFGGSSTNPLGCQILSGTFTIAPSITFGSPISGDGEWEWMWIASKVQSSSGTGNFTLRVSIDANHGIQAYNPVVLHVPANTISDNEVLSMALNLRGYLNSCAVAMVCDTVGQIPRVNQPQTWTATQTFATTATTNCQLGGVAGTTSPAGCTTATAGMIAIPASQTTYTINTSAVTANSEIFLQQMTDNSGLPSSPTCNAGATNPIQSARVAGTSFTLTLTSVAAVTCIKFWLVN